jgi:3',5'-cyclic AMP phosphodiesterase CpdA
MNDEQNVTRGYVVSDLHLFSPCSRYRELLPQFDAACASHPVVVLNGDTFEIKRSIFSSADKTSAHAVLWLEELCERHKTTQFYLILGNHDANKHLAPKLHTLSTHVANLCLISHMLQIGSTLFLHGDIVEPGALANGVEFIRDRYRHLTPSRTSTLVGRLVTSLRFNFIEHLRHRKSHLVNQVLRYLSVYHPERLQSVRTIYFGHTHVPFKGVKRNNIVFNNTGSFIKGLQWHPMEFALGEATVFEDAS